jgi:hypothetical protein
MTVKAVNSVEKYKCVECYREKSDGSGGSSVENEQKEEEIVLLD